MEQPIELHSMGEVFSKETVVEYIGDALYRIIFLTEYDGRRYEQARVIMPASTLYLLRDLIGLVALDTDHQEDRPPSPHLQ